MAIEDNILDGLDLSVLGNIATPNEEEKVDTPLSAENKEEEGPSIFNPE